MSVCWWDFRAGYVTASISNLVSRSTFIWVALAEIGSRAECGRKVLSSSLAIFSIGVGSVDSSSESVSNRISRNSVFGGCFKLFVIYMVLVGDWNLYYQWPTRPDPLRKGELTWFIVTYDGHSSLHMKDISIIARNRGLIRTVPRKAKSKLRIVPRFRDPTFKASALFHQVVRFPYSSPIEITIVGSVDPSS